MEGSPRSIPAISRALHLPHLLRRPIPSCGVLHSTTRAPLTHCFGRAVRLFRPVCPSRPVRPSRPRPPSVLHYPSTCNINRPLPFSCFYILVLPHYCLTELAHPALRMLNFFCICSARAGQPGRPAESESTWPRGQCDSLLPPASFLPRSIPPSLRSLSSHPSTVAAPQTEPPIARESNEIGRPQLREHRQHPRGQQWSDYGTLCERVD